MDILFSNILTISIQAAIAALVVVMAKKLIIDRINLRIGYLLWLLVLIRLLFSHPALKPDKHIQCVRHGRSNRRSNQSGCCLTGAVRYWLPG